MSAAGGMRAMGRTAQLLAAAAAAAGLAGCEYADAGTAPAASVPASRSYPARAPLPARDPELVAAETRNLSELHAVLAAPDGPRSGGSGGTGDTPGWMGGSGGMGDTPGRGFSFSGTVTAAGQYKVTAACVGAADAHLSVTQGARQGGTLLERGFDCGSPVEVLVDLEPGRVSAHVLRFGGGVPAPGTGAAAGVRISPSTPAP